MQAEGILANANLRRLQSDVSDAVVDHSRKKKLKKAEMLLRDDSSVPACSPLFLGNKRRKKSRDEEKSLEDGSEKPVMS